MNFLDLCYSQYNFYLEDGFQRFDLDSEHYNKKLRRIRKKRFHEFVKSLPDYKLLTEYKGSQRYVIMQHLTCGTIWRVKPTDFKNKGSRCPACAHKGMSKLEKAVQKKLQEMNISYLREYRFPECRDKYPLPFDFVLLDKEGNIFMALEVDGKQHHEPVSIFGGEKAFKAIQKHDQIKEQFCKEKGIQFKRITRKDLQIL